MFCKEIPWQDPIKFAKYVSVDETYNSWVFLNSGLNESISQSKSYLAIYPKEYIISDNFDDLEYELNHQNKKWFGYFSYNLKNNLEDLPQDKDFNIKLPNLLFINFHLIIEFDHDKKEVKCYCNEKLYLKKIPQNLDCNYQISDDVKVKNIKSNFSKEEYLTKVLDIKERIINGDLYQANLTRKFFGQIQSKNKFDIFLKLNEVSPANYSAFIKIEEDYIISSSPELFLNINKHGLVKSSPIKGTSPRFKNKKQDNISKEYLQNCPKERAENLMIVDLVRNDLSRSCKVNSVKVQNLFKINSYKTLHHMSSDVIGIKNKSVNNIELIKNCFPPASMTGTPKLKAMEVCSELEHQKRGVYSGAIGFLSHEECNLSVVIRTIIIEDNKFEFQVGGAITNGSNPLKEWEETINKSKGIALALNINLEKIKKI